MNDTDILCPRSVRLKALGREIEIRPLSIAGAIKLGRLLGALHQDIRACARANPEGKENFLLKILELTSTSQADEILNILSGGAFRNVSNLSEKLSVLELSALAKAVSEVNDFQTIVLNFTTALKATRRQPPFQAP